MEPLAITLRTGGRNWGLVIGNETHAVSLYADDLLIYVNNISSDLSEISSILTRFQRASGLKVNWDKSCIFPMLRHVEEVPITVAETLMTWQPITFKYLGINIYHTNLDLLEGNIGRAVTSLRSQIRFWITLPLSIAGRVSLSKMIMLPRLLYYFANLPIKLPLTLFKTLDSLLIELIWGTGRRRVSLGKLQLPPSEGGLGAPHFEGYYLAAQLQWLCRWLGGRQLEETASLSPPLTIDGALASFNPMNRSPTRSHCLVRTAYICFWRMLRITRQHISYAPSMPLRVLRLSITTPETLHPLNAWEDKGLDHIGDLFEGGFLIPFADLQRDYELEGGHYLAYAKVKQLLSLHWKSLNHTKHYRCYTPLALANI